MSKERVLVYGTLKEGHGNHRVILDSGGVLVDKIELGGFDMYDLGPYPAVVRGEGVIHCEVYEVEDMRLLDLLEGHPHLYRRELVGGKWLYLYRHLEASNHKGKIESGVWNNEMLKEQKNGRK